MEYQLSPSMVAGRVSVVIPAFNCSATIAASVGSCLAQRHDGVEVIVVNDGSTDGTADGLAKFGSRIRVIEQKNGGLAHARNVGTCAASGEYVAWMDADDLMEPQRLSLQQAVLAQHADIALVSTNFAAFSDRDPTLIPNYEMTYYAAASRLGGIEKIYPEVIDDVAPTRAGPCLDSLLRGNFVHPPTVMVRRDAFQKIGFFDRALRYSSDYDWILRAARLGRFAFINQTLLQYRLSPTQMSHAAGGKIALETLDILQKVRNTDAALFAKHAAFLQQKSAECWLAAANGTVPTSRATAFCYLARSMRERPMPAQAAKVFAKILVPQFAVKTVKSIARVLGLAR
jgi:glycosyltransferase involved in cell wall biosynthesis